MNTLWLLMGEFGTADIPVADVADKYLGLKPHEANRRANAQMLPFPVYRAGSQKSPYLVRATDLAAYLDAQRAEAIQVWEKINGRPAAA